MQPRWNEIGNEYQRRIAANPAAYTVRGWPQRGREAMQRALSSLHLSGLRVLDIGCGIGQMAVWMAKQGAHVTAIDVGPDLIDAARQVASLNSVSVDFRVGNATALEFADASFDAVVGMAILHHLPVDILDACMEEVRRVLRPDGVAVFFEPVEDSALFGFVQNLIPLSRPGNIHYRPAIWQRRAWAEHKAQQDDRPMTSAEFRRLGTGFARTELRYSGLTCRLWILFGNKKAEQHLLKMDDWLLDHVPPLRRFARNVVAIYSM